jgi:hypothetical protein
MFVADIDHLASRNMHQITVQFCAIGGTCVQEEAAKFPHVSHNEMHTFLGETSVEQQRLDQAHAADGSIAFCNLVRRSLGKR